MDYLKIVASLILFIVLFCLFGYQNIMRLMEDGITISQSEIKPAGSIKSPGILIYIFLLLKRTT